MEKIANSQDAEAKLLAEITSISIRAKEILEIEVRNLSSALFLLKELRKEFYEDINQILHEALLVKAIAYLERKYSSIGKIEWRWNPRQTGDSAEPDLEGRINDKILVSAEATASENPLAAVDIRMKKTLKKLSIMKGDRYYFVITEQMLKRAETKIEKANYPIKAVKCEI